jgi:hypothetical protein
VILIKYHSDDQEEWDGQGMLRVWVRGEVHTGFWWGNLRERVTWKPRRRWWAILNWIFKKSVGVVDWIDFAQDRDRWRAVVNAVMNIPVLD